MGRRWISLQISSEIFLWKTWKHRGKLLIGKRFAMWASRLTAENLPRYMKLFSEDFSYAFCYHLHLKKEVGLWHFQLLSIPYQIAACFFWYEIIHECQFFIRDPFLSLYLSFFYFLSHTFSLTLLLPHSLPDRFNLPKRYQKIRSVFKIMRNWIISSWIQGFKL